MPDGALATPAVSPGADGSPPTQARGAIAREPVIEPAFSLATHVSRTFGIAGAIGALGVWLAWGAAWWAWLAVPGFWLVANGFEYATHRYPMHKPLQPRVLYKKHALIHHRAFAGADQEIHDVTELSIVMMPWYTLLLIFGGASPIAVVAGVVGGPALAGVFLISAVSYFLFYELIHTLHHLPLQVLERSWWGRRPMLARMRAHHHHHHRLDRMTEVNFNVTFAITDRLMGTYELP